MKFRSIIIGVVLFAIYLISIWYRVRLGKNQDYYDSRDPTAYYWTENALQYHYAELIARGKSIPVFDPMLQAPDGVKIFENLTILMEYPCGWLYRFLGLDEKNILFHTWTIIFIAGCASLGIFAIYLLSRALGINHFYSILAGLLSSFSLVGVDRSTFGFLNEDFALPFIIFGLAGYFFAINNSKNRIIFAIISGICFLISLCSWHFSRFVFLTIVLVSVFNLLFFEKGKRIRENAFVLFFILLIPFLGSFLAPVLRTHLYFISTPFALGFGTILGIILFEPKPERPLIFSTQGLYSITIALVFFVASIIVTGILKTETEYLHVWSLLINKIKFFGIKPSNPELLDYPARSLWIEAFNSPNCVSFFKNLFPIIIPAIFGFIYLLKNRFSESVIRMLLALCIIFFISYLLIERMGVVNNYFISILSVIVETIKLKKDQIFNKYLAPIILMIIFLFNFYQGYHLHNPTGYIKLLRNIFGNEIAQEIYNWRLNNVELVRYIKYRTPENAIFLSSFGAGPLIFTYAHRATVLQPKFEVRNCQNRVKEFLESIYSSEKDFYNFCKKYKVNYFLYDSKILLDNSRDGSRWVAAKMKIKSGDAAFLFHFFPEDLKYFELVYQNNYYRLYRIIEEDESRTFLNFVYQPIYDLKAFGNQTKEIEFFDDRYTKDVIERIKKAKILLQRANAILIKNPEQAYQLMEKSIALYPALIGSATTLGIACALSDRIDMGLSLCQKEVEINPLFPLGHYNLAYCLYLKNDINGAINELEESLRLDPNFSPAREMLKQLED
uniref:Tetratricopeptide repeat protein n=1 Tax=candidate division WOR-3 bacterium TaxID=2052148 RepID=A0A7V1EHQ8_UNCW3